MTRLEFGPGNSTGFTPAGIAAFSDLRPAAVVRELVQNAYDAAHEAGRDRSVVRFRLDTMPADGIPHIDDYEAAFDAAIDTQEHMGGGHLPAKANLVVNTIGRALHNQQQRVLSVLDNGIGLNERRMNALLSDGVSAKSNQASGTFGNGHSVAIPASDLRYLLYGGVLPSGAMIGSGHAVLASHVSPYPGRGMCSGDGFLVKRLRDGQDGIIFDCPRDDDIPKVIHDHLMDILSDVGHGSAVIIPAFNNFRESRSLWEMVAEATACNFFQAVAEGSLVVEVEDLTEHSGLGPQVLDRRSIRHVLKNNRDKQRSRAFLSGKRAYGAYDALTRSTVRSSVTTSQGSIQIRILNKSSGIPRVDLCRNGMWITDDKNIPGFANKFRDRRPFHALLLLGSDGGDLYRLVREAEGPLHNKLFVKDLDMKDRKAIRQAFEEVRQWLLGHTEEMSSKSFTPDDFLVLNFSNDDDPFWGTPVVVGRRAPERSPVRTQGRRRQHGNVKNRLDPTGRSRRRSTVPFFSAVSVPIAANRRTIEVTCYSRCDRAELRLSVDEHIDPTCDRVARDPAADVELFDVSIGGEAADHSQLVTQNGSVVGVRLGDLAEGQRITLEVEYGLSDYFAGVDALEACLLVEVIPGQQEEDES